MADTYSAEDVARLAAAADEITGLMAFVMTRFHRYVELGLAKNDHGNPVTSNFDSPDTDRTTGGWGTWRIQRMFPLSETVKVEHHLADERTAGTITSRVEMPWRFVFGDDDRESRYAQYLALRAEFEPTAP